MSEERYVAVLMQDCFYPHPFCGIYDRQKDMVVYGSYISPTSVFDVLDEVRSDPDNQFWSSLKDGELKVMYELTGSPERVQPKNVHVTYKNSFGDSLEVDQLSRNRVGLAAYSADYPDGYAILDFNKETAVSIAHSILKAAGHHE